METGFRDEFGAAGPSRPPIVVACTQNARRFSFRARVTAAGAVARSSGAPRNRFLPHFSFSTVETRAVDGLRKSVTSQWPSNRPPSSGGERLEPAFLQRVALPGQRDFRRPPAWQALAIPHAIERLLATPRNDPRVLPCIRPEFLRHTLLPPELEQDFSGYTSPPSRYSPNRATVWAVYRKT